MNPALSIPAGELDALSDKFREVKHSVNNTLAVIMALSELAQRNPSYYEKLAQAVLARCPQIVSQLQEFQKEIPKNPVPEAEQDGDQEI